MIEAERITIKPFYPAFAYLVIKEGEFRVSEFEDHVDVWRSDSRGRWRRRKTMPPRFEQYLHLLHKYDLLPEES